MLEVIIRLGERVFQSSEVSGAVCSGDLEFESRASGVNFRGCCCCCCCVVAFAERVIELLEL